MWALIGFGYDLAEYFKKLNIRVSINSHSDIIKSNEVIILGKSDVKHLNFYKKNILTI